MKFLAKITDKNEIDFKSKAEVKLLLNRLKGKEIEVIIKKKTNQRTGQQNNALHLYFKLLAEALNDAGWDQKKLLKKEVDIPWTADSVKKMLWVKIQMSLLNKKRTRDLNKDEVPKIYDIVNRHIGEKTGVFVEFPNIESLIARGECL